MAIVECSNRAYPVKGSADEVAKLIDDARHDGNALAEVHDDQDRAFFLNPDHVVSVEG